MSDEKRIEELSALEGARRTDGGGVGRDTKPVLDGGALAREPKPVLERVVVRAERAAELPADPPHARAQELAPPREPRHRVAQPDILNIDEAAELLGVSIKTFNKVLHSQNMPARKIGREWKFSRQALIDWVGSGRSRDFYRESGDEEEDEPRVDVKPQASPAAERPRSRRTAGWQIEMD